MAIKFKITFVIFICLINQYLKGQSTIEGQLIIDTAIWRPVAYLSIIPDLDKLNTMSNEMIIDAVDINPSGKFVFRTQYFPKEDNLFRIHIVKKKDPPVSLIIGGLEENFFFFLANNKTQITIRETNGQGFIRDVSIKGYYPNDVVHQINEITNYLDSTSFNGSSVKNDLIKSAIFEKLRIIADTCSSPIVSLYAIYKGDFENNFSVNQQFYKNFLLKWKQNKSTYLVAFRKKIPSVNTTNISNSIIIGIISFVIGLLTCLLAISFLKKKNNIVQDLSIQERKIYGLILEGKSNKEIAEALTIELSTVKSHLNSIYSKLHISSRKDILNLNLDNYNSTNSEHGQLLK